MSVSSAAAAERDPRRALLGAAMVMTAALVYTASIILARIVYNAGGSAMTVLAVRYAVGAMLLFVGFRLRGQSLWLSGPIALRMIGIGLLVSAYAYGYLGSIQFIPVSLAVLIFYTNPLFVALAAWLVNRERLRPIQIAAIVIGLAGVALAVEVSFDALDPRGLGLALLAAIGIAATVTVSQRTMRRTGSLAITFYVNLVPALVYITAGLAFTGFPLPALPQGWWALAALTISFPLGTLLFYAAIHRIGGVKTATMMNAEPVFTMLGAVAILGERLAPFQLVGAALVLAAILLVHRR